MLKCPDGKCKGLKCRVHPLEDDTSQRKIIEEIMRRGVEMGWRRGERGATTYLLEDDTSAEAIYTISESTPRSRRRDGEVLGRLLEII